MPTVREHIDAAKRWLTEYNGLAPTVTGTNLYELSLEECVKGIKLLEASGVNDGEMTQCREEIEQQGKCSRRAEEIIARMEDHLS